MFTEFIGDLASKLNIVPEKDKMTIIPMQDIGPVPLPAGPPYITQFAPENYQTTEGQNMPRLQAQGNNEPEAQYAGSQGEDFSFDILIDGTGASGSRREVMADVLILQSVTGFNGALHHPNYLTIVWGKFLRTAVLQNMVVKYTLFRPDGTPLRATVTCQFRKHVPRLQSLLESRLSSPDLTQQRIVRKGDRLDLVCQRHYGDARHYLNVAKENDLTSFRFLVPGSDLNLPPVTK